jgi:hypothetical protein
VARNDRPPQRRHRRARAVRGTYQLQPICLAGTRKHLHTAPRLRSGAHGWGAAAGKPGAGRRGWKADPMCLSTWSAAVQWGAVAWSWASSKLWLVSGRGDVGACPARAQPRGGNAAAGEALRAWEHKATQPCVLGAASALRSHHRHICLILTYFGVGGLAIANRRQRLGGPIH